MTKIVTPDALAPLPPGGLRKLLRTIEEGSSLKGVTSEKAGRISLHNEVIKENSTVIVIGSVYFREGNIYSVTYDGFIPPIATRLYTGGFIKEEIYQYLSQVETNKVGIEAIKNGYINQDILDSINRQMVLSSLTYLYGWEKALWQWDSNKTFDGFRIPELPIDLILASADERMGQWEALNRKFPQVTKPNAIPFPGPDWADRKVIDPSPEMERLSILVAEGNMTISKIATACGFTRFEIAAKLAKAVIDGILVVSDQETMKNGQNSSLEGLKLQSEYEMAKIDLEMARVNFLSADNHFKEIQARIGISDSK